MSEEAPNLRLKRFGKWKWTDLVLYADEHLVAVNKPLGISTLAERWTDERNLSDIARAHDDHLRPVHRLDKYTTGVLIFARTPEAFRNLALQFQRRKVHKEYLALVKGNWEFDGFEVDAPIAQGAKGQVRVDLQEGKPSLTRLFTQQQWRDYTLLRAEPITGRSHQIRVHLSYIHCPVVGDHLYGGEDLYVSGLKRRGYQRHWEDPERPLNTEYVLHCHRLGLHHPADGRLLTLEAPLSANLLVCLRQLDKYNALS
ncbi:MAG: RluA family pseudouridine synthase [Bacteroidetes bacterium]|nr:RluA family pseudouridine synthase [Bacteroidota bacterium]